MSGLDVHNPEHTMEGSEDADGTLEELTALAASRLAEYIRCRQQIIAALRNMPPDEDGSGQRLRTLLLGKKPESSGTVRHGSSLWLFGDTFLTFVHAAGDAVVAKCGRTLDRMNVCNLAYRPKLDIFFSGNEEAPERDALAVEFRPCGVSHDCRVQSFWTMSRTIQAVRSSAENIGTLWCFTVTEFDDSFRENILSQDFRPRSVNGKQDEIYCRFYQNANAHCCCISMDALLTEAESRNAAIPGSAKKMSGRFSAADDVRQSRSRGAGQAPQT